MKAPVLIIIAGLCASGMLAVYCFDQHSASPSTVNTNLVQQIALVTTNMNVHFPPTVTNRFDGSVVTPVYMRDDPWFKYESIKVKTYDEK